MSVDWRSAAILGAGIVVLQQTDFPSRAVRSDGIPRITEHGLHTVAEIVLANETSRFLLPKKIQTPFLITLFVVKLLNRRRLRRWGNGNPMLQQLLLGHHRHYVRNALLNWMVAGTAIAVTAPFLPDSFLQQIEWLMSPISFRARLPQEHGILQRARDAYRQISQYGTITVAGFGALYYIARARAPTNLFR